MIEDRDRLDNKMAVGGRLNDIRNYPNQYAKGGLKVRKPTYDPQANAQIAMQFFMNKGLSRHQAAGLVGNLMRESMLNPNADNPSSNAMGIAQWLGNRKKALIARYGNTPTLLQQLDFVWHELNTTHRRGLQAIRASKTAEEAAANGFGWYEFSVGPQGAIADMNKHGQKGLDSYNKGLRFAAQLNGTPVNPAYLQQYQQTQGQNLQMQMPPMQQQYAQMPQDPFPDWQPWDPTRINEEMSDPREAARRELELQSQPVLQMADEYFSAKQAKEQEMAEKQQGLNTLLTVLSLTSPNKENDSYAGALSMLSGNSPFSMMNMSAYGGRLYDGTTEPTNQMRRKDEEESLDRINDFINAFYATQNNPMNVRDRQGGFYLKPGMTVKDSETGLPIDIVRQESYSNPILLNETDYFNPEIEALAKEYKGNISVPIGRDQFGNEFPMYSANHTLPEIEVKGHRHYAAEDMDKVMLGTLVAGVAPFAAAETAPYLASLAAGASDAAMATKVGQRVASLLTNPYFDAWLTSYFGAHGLNDIKNGNANAMTALEILPLMRVGKAAIKEGPALIRDFNYWNPKSMVNRNIRINYANEKVPIGYSWKDPKNITPALKGIKQALVGERAFLLPLEDVVARDFVNTLKTEPFIRNSHIGFRKYLGLEDEHVLNSLVTEQPLSAYIPRKDGSFYVNLGDEENEMLLSNFSKNKGQGLYDTALGSHGGMGAKYENGVLHFEDVLDYQPFQSYKKLPKFIREFEPSTIIPGAKPFKWSGDIHVSDYIDPAIYERYIQHGLGEGPLVKNVTGKAYLPISQEEFNAKIAKMVEDYIKSHPLRLK